MTRMTTAQSALVILVIEQILQRPGVGNKGAARIERRELIGLSRGGARLAHGGQTSTQQLVDLTAQTGAALNATLPKRSSNIIVQGERGSHDLSLMRATS